MRTPLRLSRCSPGNRGGHSPDQELQEDHVTAAAGEHQAHREERAHGGRGEGERARGGSARLDHYLGGGTELRPFPERRSSPAPPPTLPARGAVVHCQPRPHSFEGALWSQADYISQDAARPLRRAGTCPASAGTLRSRKESSEVLVMPLAIGSRRVCWEVKFNPAEVVSGE